MLEGTHMASVLIENQEPQATECKLKMEVRVGFLFHQLNQGVVPQGAHVWWRLIQTSGTWKQTSRAACKAVASRQREEEVLVSVWPQETFLQHILP